MQLFLHKDIEPLGAHDTQGHRLSMTPGVIQSN